MLSPFKILVAGMLMLSASSSLTAQNIHLLDSAAKISLRGLSVVNDRVVWASGTDGTVARSVDSGNTFKWIKVKGFEKTDFRDIEAFDENTAVIMAIAEPAYILRTTDGGESWQVAYENKTKGMFLDAMEFWNNGQDGLAVGDAMENTFFLTRTRDGGKSWQDLAVRDRAKADSGEGCFASSGTNIRILDSKEAVLVSGGLTSNIVIGKNKMALPLIQGRESTGANSVAAKNNKILIVVGGDFTKKASTEKNCFITRDAGKTWIAPATPPHGYRSSVEWLGKISWISCGLNGIDYSMDEGINWKWISKESFHVCRKAKNGTSVFFAGNNGRIARLDKK